MQFFSTNTKPLFWKSKTDLESFQKRSSHIGASYKVVSESFKRQNSVFCVIEYPGSKMQSLVNEHETDFLGKRWETLKLFKTFLYIL